MNAYGNATGATIVWDKLAYVFAPSRNSNDIGFLPGILSCPRLISIHLPSLLGVA